jgi:uncharacterized membrane protein
MDAAVTAEKSTGVQVAEVVEAALAADARGLTVTPRVNGVGKAGSRYSGTLEKVSTFRRGTEWTMDYARFMDYITKAFEVAGVAVLMVGFISAFAHVVVVRVRRGTRHQVYGMVRTYFGRSLLLSLEIFVAADLIRTVAVEPTLQNVLVLGLIVLIRTFLSFSLQVEMDGIMPWRRGRLEAPPSQPTEGAPRG